MTITHRLLALAALPAVVLAACGDDGSGATVDDASGSAATAAPTTTSTAPDCPDPELPPGTEVGDAEILYTSTCRAFVRTPEEAFAGIEDYPYEPRYAEVDGMRMAYVEAGPADGEVVLMLHGEPSWSYLYRKMIPVLADAGYHAIALDMMGMGRSDKPVELGDYSYHQHVAWVTEFLEVTDLTDVTAFVQDWGSLVGLRVVADVPERFARVVVANGRLPLVPEGFQPITVVDPPTPDETVEPPFPCERGWLSCFEQWANYALVNPDFRPSDVAQVVSATELTDAELAAYDAPFPGRIWMSGVRTFPSLINTVGEPPTNQAAWDWFGTTDMPVLTLFGRLDHNLGTAQVQAEMSERVPGARGQAHHAYPDAAHFIQEDEGADLARRVVAFVQANPLP